jgi:hypothetical protein
MGIFRACAIKPENEFRFRPQMNSTCILWFPTAVPNLVMIHQELRPLEW